MKTGKGFYLIGQPCQRCHESIGPGTAEQPAYWSYEDVYDPREGMVRRYYHRSCARKVTRERNKQWQQKIAAF